MGGGRQVMQSNVSAGESDPVDSWACYRRDGRDLIDEWTRDKSDRMLAYSVVQNNDELSRLDIDNVDYLLGIFANGHIEMDWERERGPKGQPSLEQMTTAALRILQKSPQGYFLMVVDLRSTARAKLTPTHTHKYTIALSGGRWSDRLRSPSRSRRSSSPGDRAIFRRHQRHSSNDRHR